MRTLVVLSALLLSGAPIMANPPRVEIIGHRGASWDAPENTVSAIKLAWQQQADGSEFDVYLSKDGKIVVIHDKDTYRTAKINRVIAKTTLADLRKLDVGKWKNAKYTGEKIPTLDEMLATVPEGKKVFIEVKCGPEIVPELQRVLSTSRLKPTQMPVISFNSDVIEAVKKAMPEVPAYWLVGLKQKKGKEIKVEDLIEKVKKIKADGLDLSATKELDKVFAAKIKEAGLKLYVYTVNDLEVARRMIEIGVDGITTDRPGWLRAKLLK